MAILKGITVTLINKIPNGGDPFDNPTYKEMEIKVDNVIVAPASTDDITNSLNLTGRKAVYTLGIPKGDTHDWENAEVRFFNERWRTFGIPIEGIEALVPLDWHKKVMVERYE